MDYSQLIDKNVLRKILDNLPNIPENASIMTGILQMLAQQQVWARPFTYSINFAIVGAANQLPANMVAPQLGNVVIQADADFLILNQTYDCNSANAARTANSFVMPNAKVVLINIGDGAQYMDTAVNVTELFGNTQLGTPYILPEPLFLPAKSNLQAQVTNFDVAQGINLFLHFNGVRLKKQA